MKKFLISESEKNRILEMHKRAVRKEWVLNEASGDDDGSGKELKNAGIRSISPADTTDSNTGGLKAAGGATFVQLVDINGITLYYNCIRDPRASKKEVDVSPTIFKTGSLMDQNYNDVRNNTILHGNWEQILQKNCSSAYSFVNNWRAENCPKLNAKTYWDYNNQCSIYMNAQAAEKQQQAQATADADAQKVKDAEAAKEKADMDARTAAANAKNLEAKTSAASFSEPFNKLYSELFTLVSSSPMGSQQEIEDKINQLNTMYNDPNLKTGRLEAKDNNSIATTIKNTPKLLQQAKAQYPGITATFGKSL